MSHLLRNPKLLITLVVILSTGIIYSLMVPGIDHLPLVYGLRAELTGSSAYDSTVADQIQDLYTHHEAHGCARCADAGFAYPLPAVFFALPTVFLPEHLSSIVWMLLSLGTLLVGLHLMRMPWVWLLYAPILIALRYNNLTALLVGLLLIGIWAYYKKRWWLLGFIIALTSGAKPQTTLVFAGALAWLAWREKNWRPIVVWGGVIGGLSLLLDPTWPLAWLHHIQTYQHSIRMTWHVWWLPIAVLLAFYRLWLPVLAILQVSLFPMQLHLYTLMPLLPGYTNQTWRTVVVVVICSWLWLFTVPLGMDQVLALTLCYILPFTLTSLPLRQIAKQLAVLDHKSLRRIR